MEWWVYDANKNGQTGEFVPPGPPGTLESDGTTGSSNSHWENPILNGTEHNPIRITEQVLHEAKVSFQIDARILIGR